MQEEDEDDEQANLTDGQVLFIKALSPTRSMCLACVCTGHAQCDPEDMMHSCIPQLATMAWFVTNVHAVCVNMTYTCDSLQLSLGHMRKMSNTLLNRLFLQLLLRLLYHCNAAHWLCESYTAMLSPPQLSYRLALNHCTTAATLAHFFTPHALSLPPSDTQH